LKLFPAAAEGSHQIARLCKAPAITGNHAQRTQGNDPWSKEGMLIIREVRPWTVFLDGTIIDT
jgi:hypothetical protein